MKKIPIVNEQGQIIYIEVEDIVVEMMKPIIWRATPKEDWLSNETGGVLKLYQKEKGEKA